MNTEAESSPDAGPRCPSRDGTARIASAADRGRSSLFRAWINFHAAESEGHHYGASDIHAHICPRSEMRVNEKNVEHWMLLLFWRLIRHLARANYFLPSSIQR